jgi:hypothetical protein
MFISLVAAVVALQYLEPAARAELVVAEVDLPTRERQLREPQILAAAVVVRVCKLTIQLLPAEKAVLVL